jgi:hypothetical protein
MGVVLSIAPSAWAFRTLEDYDDVPDGARVAWPDGEFEFWTYERGTDSVSAEALAETSRIALWAWQSVPCARVAPTHVGISPFPAEPDDGINTIEIVEENWEDLGFPADAAGANDVLFGELEDGSWAILEADIYINAEYHRFSTASTPEDDERSLLGVLMHESGHALGLLHPCEPDGADDAPACDPDDAPSDLMSPYYASDHQDPETEDEAGLCYLYPACETDDDCAEGSRCSASECVVIEVDGGDCTSGAGGEGGEECTPKSPTGAKCSESNECEGGECVAGVEETPICTLRCDQKDSVCPTSWTCADVEDRSVCLPPNPEAGCTCTLLRPRDARERALSSFSMLACFSVLLLFGVRRKRRPQTTARLGSGCSVENAS